MNRLETMENKGCNDETSKRAIEERSVTKQQLSCLLVSVEIARADTNAGRCFQPAARMAKVYYW